MQDRGLVYNINKVRELILKAKGPDDERSIRQYAMDSDVSPANISRILKGDYKASPETLKKLTSEKAKPRCGVTFEELMVAAGYLEDLQENINTYELGVIEAFSNEKQVEEPEVLTKEDDKGSALSANDRLLAYALKSGLIHPDKMPNELTREARDQIRTEINRSLRRAQSQFELIGTGAVFQALAKGGIQFTVMNPNETMARRYRPDMAIKVIGDTEKEWWFEFKSCSEMPDDIIMHRNHRHIMDRFIYMAPNPSRKITLVVDMELIYEQLLELKGDISFKGDLSIAFLNKNTMTIEREEYLSHYYDDNHYDIKLV